MAILCTTFQVEKLIILPGRADSQKGRFFPKKKALIPVVIVMTNTDFKSVLGMTNA